VSVGTELLVEFLQRPRMEVLPLDGVEQQVTDHIPTELKVTVTASPARGLEPTLALCERLASQGYRVVPHLAARLVRDRAHLGDLLARFRAHDLREVFVIAGDARRPAGEFEGAPALLSAMAELGHGLEDIGISGYPESHALISDEVTIRAMFEKEGHATYIVSQLTFDADVIATWVRRVRARGTELPIYIGMAAPVAARKLLRISGRIGLGESARFLQRHKGWLRRLLVPRAYRPDPLLERLGPLLGDPRSRIAGLHIYTFNEIERAERWRRETLARLEGG
jgi:methylenetetrahydrofolate reductase (NADPH)